MNASLYEKEKETVTPSSSESNSRINLKSQYEPLIIRQQILKPRCRQGFSENSMPIAKSYWMDVQPTLSQTWKDDERRSAICVQSVDAHMSCSSHSDAQLAAFFIDPRAK